MSKKFRGWPKMNALANKSVHPDQPPTEQNPALASGNWHALARNGVEQGELLPLTPSTPALSEAKLTANRLNAQLSCGPITDLGRQIVSQNATRHGLTGKFRVLAGESQSDFDQMLASFLRNEDPVGEDEVAMVHQMAECLWLSRRSVRMQNDCFAVIESGTGDEQKHAKKDLVLYLRYQTTHERTFIRLSAEMRKRRNERRKLERGFVSQKHREAAETRREANEIRKKEAHEIRQAIANCRRERMEIQNRAAEAKLERHAAASQTLAGRTETAGLEQSIGAC